jgi:large subunit ribosomal protein L25
MADLFELSVTARSNLGKGHSRRLRRIEKMVPAVIYGAGQPAASVMVTHRQLEHALQNEAFYSHILTLNFGDKQEKVVLKDLQRHPSRPLLMHADFQRINAKEKLTMHIPLHFINEDKAPGVKVDKGIISHQLNEVEVRCLPADLPEYIEVDMSEVQMDQAVHLSHLKLPKGVELVALSHHDDRMVVNIHKLVVIEEPETVVAPPAEVPVIGKETAAEGEGAEGEAKK